MRRALTPHGRMVIVMLVLAIAGVLACLLIPTRWGFG